MPQMTVDKLLSILAARGLKVEVNDRGDAKLVGDKSKATKWLLKVLKIFKPAIMERFKPALQMECKWGGGYIERRYFPEAPWPVGAWWWRYVGETEWKEIPGADSGCALQATEGVEGGGLEVAGVLPSP